MQDELNNELKEWFNKFELTGPALRESRFQICFSGLNTILQTKISPHFSSKEVGRQFVCRANSQSLHLCSMIVHKSKHS